MLTPPVPLVLAEGNNCAKLTDILPGLIRALTTESMFASNSQ